MKILLDHNLDRRLKNFLADYEVETAQENGWADVQNGELLHLAEENRFDVVLTADGNIREQQNLAGRNIAVLVLRAVNNRLSTHGEMIDGIVSALLEIKRGDIIDVFHKNMN